MTTEPRHHCPCFLPWLLALALGGLAAWQYAPIHDAALDVLAPWLYPATEGGATTGDPSAEAAPDTTDPSKFAERYRILADLDGDGLEDQILSQPIREFGKMGGLWSVLLARDGGFVEVGDIAAHPGAIAIEPDADRIQRDPGERMYARIWVYLRGGAGAGTMTYFRVGPNQIEETQGLQIYPGDGGTDLGRGLIRALFAASPIPFRQEISTTAADGSVTWTETKR